MDATLPCLGLDISKCALDCALILNGKVKSRSFSNDLAGFDKLIDWLTRQNVIRVHACCEATGVYHESVAVFLHERAHAVSVVNPAQIAAYGRAHLSRAKTDALDAWLIARFCERERPPEWAPLPPAERELLALLRDLRDLMDMERAESNRLGTAHASVCERIERHLAYLSRKIAEVRKKIEHLIDSNKHLKSRRDLLDSVPGLGDATIPWLLAYLGDGQRFNNAKCASAFFGLCPKPHESGSSVHGKARIAKTGHNDLRRALYMPAVVAFSRCQAFAPFVQRMKAAGKPSMVIIVALMRKLVAIAQAILKSGKKFDPNMHHA